MKSKNLVFLHGFPLNGKSWQPQIQAFKNHSVLAPDLRGHGSGPKGAGPWMMADFAEDLKKLLDEKKIEKAVICGLSMGGYVALQFAQTYPSNVEALILCDTQADADSNEAKDKRFATIEKIRKEGMGPFAEDFSKAVLCEQTLTQKPDLQKQVIEMIKSNQPENMTMVVGALASRRDSNAYLAKFNFPTLILVGEADKTTPVALSQKLKDGIKNSKMHVIEKAAHLSNLEQPEVFNQHLKIFLDSL